MNNEQKNLIAQSRFRVTAAQGLANALAEIGGSAPSVNDYNLALNKVAQQDAEIESMPGGNEKKLSEAMNRLDVLIQLVMKSASQYEADVAEARKRFYDGREKLLASMQSDIDKTDVELVAAFRGVAKGLKKRWQLAERKIRLEQYLMSVYNESPALGMQLPPPSRINIGLGTIGIMDSELYAAYIKRFAALLPGIGEGDGLTTDYFFGRQ